MAINLVDAIDYDWAKFGFTHRQDMALRALTFDKYTRRYLVDHPHRAPSLRLPKGCRPASTGSAHRASATSFVG